MMKINKFCAFAWQFVIASGLQMDAPATSFAEFLGAAAEKYVPDDGTDAEDVLGAPFRPDIAAAVTTSFEVPDDVPTSLKEVLAEAEGKKSDLLPWGYDGNTRLWNQNSAKLFSK